MNKIFLQGIKLCPIPYEIWYSATEFIVRCPSVMNKFIFNDNSNDRNSRIVNTSHKSYKIKMQEHVQFKQILKISECWRNLAANSSTTTMTAGPTNFNQTSNYSLNLVQQS